MKSLRISCQLFLYHIMLRGHNLLIFKSIFERLQADYGREVSKNSSLSERIYEVCAERDSLKGKVRDYERVRRAIGLEQADRILEAAYQQEQAEKERKRAARQKTRVGAR